MKSVFKRTDWFLAATLLLLPVSAQDAQNVQICNLFSNPAQYHGLMVDVEGEILPSTAEADAELTAPCAARVVIGGVTFRNRISLTSSMYSNGKLRAPFDWDRASYSRLYQLERAVDIRTERIVGRVVGVFETRVPLSRLVDKGREFGFGHLGLAPAQILVQTVLELRIEKRE